MLHWRWLLLGYVLVLGVLLLAKAYRVPLWLDEAYSVYVAKHSVSGLLREVRDAERWPPVYYVLLSMWMRVFGDSEIAARSLSVCCFLVGLLLTYRLALGSGLSNDLGWIAVWFAATTSLLVSHASNARGYALLFVLSAWATIHSFGLFVSEQKGMSYHRVLFYVASALAGLLTHYSFIYLLFAQGLYMLKQDRRMFLRYSLCTVLIIALFLVIWGSSFVWQLYYTAEGREWMRETPMNLLVRTVLSPFGSGGRGTIVGAFCWLLILLSLLRGKPEGKPGFIMEHAQGSSALSFMLVATLLPQLLVGIFVPSFVPERQGIVALPFFVILLAKTLATLLPKRVLFVLLVALSLVRLSVVSSSALKPDTVTGSDKWVARYVVLHVKPGDVVVLSDLSYCPVRYYLQKLKNTNDYYILSFPPEVASHQGWMGRLKYEQNHNLQAALVKVFLKQLRAANPRANVVLAKASGRLYDLLDQNLRNIYTEVARIKVPHAESAGTFVREIIVFKAPATTLPPPLHPNPDATATGGNRNRVGLPARSR